MSRKKSLVDPSIYRFICLKLDCKNYHVDFQTKEDAIKYADELKDDTIEWYGIYELNSSKDYMVRIIHKRLLPHKTTVYTSPESNKRNKNKKE